MFTVRGSAAPPARSCRVPTNARTPNRTSLTNAFRAAPLGEALVAGSSGFEGRFCVHHQTHPEHQRRDDGSHTLDRERESISASSIPIFEIHPYRAGVDDRRTVRRRRRESGRSPFHIANGK